MLDNLQENISEYLLNHFNELDFAYSEIDMKPPLINQKDFYVILGNHIMRPKFRILVKCAMLPEKPPAITPIEEKIMLEIQDEVIMNHYVAYIQFKNSYDEIPKIIVNQVSLK